MTIRLLSALALLLSAVSRPMSGQRSLAVDITANSGTGEGGEYTARNLAGERIGLSLRLHPSSRRVGVFFDLALDDLSGTRTSDLVCYPASHGGCVPDYPAFAGFSLAAGVLMVPRSRVEVRLGGGAGLYYSTRAQGGAAAILGQGDVAVFPLRHFGLVIGRRVVSMPNYHGLRLHEFPWTAGLRVR